MCATISICKQYYVSTLSMTSRFSLRLWVLPFGTTIKYLICDVVLFWHKTASFSEDHQRTWKPVAEQEEEAEELISLRSSRTIKSKELLIDCWMIADPLRCSKVSLFHPVSGELSGTLMSLHSWPEIKQNLPGCYPFRKYGVRIYDDCYLPISSDL